jgi:hypothetical protein
LNSVIDLDLFMLELIKYYNLVFNDRVKLLNNIFDSLDIDKDDSM